jgi:hypothetical protein
MKRLAILLAGIVLGLIGAVIPASAKVGDKGGVLAGAISVSDGIWMYQLTDKGLAVEITAKSTKYFKDDALN